MQPHHQASHHTPQTGTSQDLEGIDPISPSTGDSIRPEPENNDPTPEDSAAEESEEEPTVPEEELAKILGCSHYKRNCSIVAPCCGKEYVCRHCHNEAESHEIDRYAVSEIRCLKCSTRQSTSNSCTQCGTQFARYFCPICKFWENTPHRKLYHCAKCGICRVGNHENFFHCDVCGMDFHKTLFGKHKCITDSGKSDCPVCLDNIFTSRIESTMLKCGHIMHVTCLQQLLEHNRYMCPLCSKSMVDMRSYFRELDRAVSTVQMPDEYCKRINILCNDCLWKGEGAFHFYGIKCESCGSYNTAQRK